MRFVGSRSLVALAVVAAACGHSSPSPPQFLHLEILEQGSASSGQTASGIRIEPTPEGDYVLRRDRQYIARVEVRTSGGPERCLFRPFFFSWSKPSRAYDCYPEVEDGTQTIEVYFHTSSFDVDLFPEHHVGVQLREHGPGREFIALYDERRYAVSFED